MLAQWAMRRKKSPGITGAYRAKTWLEVIEPVIENPYPLTGV